MITKAMVDDFLAQRTLAIVGVSRTDKNKFGNAAFKDLKEKGYKMYIVHPSGEVIEGAQSFASLKALPEQVGGVLVVVPPVEAEKVVREAHEVGISRIWLQQGAESKDAIQYCQDNGMSVVYGKCIMMFAQPMKFMHKPHRWVMGLLGQLPK
jgi:predicted CoA-binding protein